MRAYLAVALCCALLLAPLPALSQPVPDETAKVGDQASNLRLLPPWTMQKCPRELRATYTAPEALQLKKLDSQCWMWKGYFEQYHLQMTAWAEVKVSFEAIQKSYEDSQALAANRIVKLTKQLNDTIAEKNKYKYQPTYSWLYISIGAAVALVGLSFGVGVWVAKD